MIVNESLSSNKIIILSDFPKTKSQIAKLDADLSKLNVKIIPIFIKSNSSQYKSEVCE